jgi:hypothetical protein
MDPKLNFTKPHKPNRPKMNLKKLFDKASGRWISESGIKVLGKDFKVKIDEDKAIFTIIVNLQKHPEIKRKLAYFENSEKEHLKLLFRFRSKLKQWLRLKKLQSFQ